MALSLKAFIGLDGSGFLLGGRQVMSAVDSMSAKVNSIKGHIAAAFSVGAITALTRKSLDYAGHLQDLSNRLGVSTDFLQEFRYVAKQTGTDLDRMTVALEKMNSARDVALSGSPESKKMLAAFRAFGISEGDLKNKRLEDLISGPIVSSFSRGDVQGKLGAAWREIGGKGAGELIQAFTDGFNAKREQARKSGNVWSEDIIQQLDDVGDHFAILGDRIVIEWGNAIIAMIGWVRKLQNTIAQAASYLGARTQDFNKKDFLSAGLFLLNPWLTPHFKPVQQMLEKWDKNEVAGGQAALDVEAELKRQLAEEAAARAAAREARARGRLPGAAGVEPVSTNVPLAKEDALVRVGNFLGASQSTMARIGQETNNLLRTNNDLTRQIRELIAGMSKGTIAVP